MRFYGTCWTVPAPCGFLILSLLLLLFSLSNWEISGIKSTLVGAHCSFPANGEIPVPVGAVELMQIPAPAEYSMAAHHMAGNYIVLTWLWLQLVHGAARPALLSWTHTSWYWISAIELIHWGSTAVWTTATLCGRYMLYHVQTRVYQWRITWHFTVRKQRSGQLVTRPRPLTGVEGSCGSVGSDGSAGENGGGHKEEFLISWLMMAKQNGGKWNAMVARSLVIPRLSSFLATILFHISFHCTTPNNFKVENKKQNF